jgi:hypothetical protein
MSICLLIYKEVGLCTLLGIELIQDYVDMTYWIKSIFPIP